MCIVNTIYSLTPPVDQQCGPRTGHHQDGCSTFPKAVSGKAPISPATPLMVKVSISGAVPLGAIAECLANGNNGIANGFFVIFSLFFYDFFPFAQSLTVVHFLPYWMNKHAFIANQWLELHRNSDKEAGQARGFQYIQLGR